MASTASESGKSLARRLKSTVSKSPALARPPAPNKPFGVGRDPALSAYINAKALGKPEGLQFQELFKSLFDAINGDKSGRQQLYGILLRLFFYEELPGDLILQLVPLLQGQAKETKVTRAVFHLLEVYVGAGSAGTPTLYDPSLVGKRPDPKALDSVLAEAWSVLQQPDADPALRRATFVLAAAAARGSDPVRKELVAQVQRAITAADNLAGLAGALGGGKGKGSPAKPAALDWDLQHTAFLAVRLAAAATGADSISRSAFVGVGSADPVGARHALALVADVAYRDAGFVAREMGQLVAAAAKQYEASGPGPIPAPGQSVNLEDTWARLYLARACAYVLHSDQSSGDVSRDGAPFWHMLHLLAIRDNVDMVRFGAMEALTGAVPSAGGAALGVGANAGGVGGRGGSKAGGLPAAATSREDVVFQQRRGRAWRLLVSQSGLQVSIPGAQGAAAAPMKLIECLGRLLMAGLRNSATSPSRFCAACSVVASLAESCLASQSVGSSRHNTSPEVDRVMTGLGAGLSASLEGDLCATQRCACLEALLYLQAAGYPTGLTPAKMVAAAGRGSGSAWACGLQDSLLSTVLKCAKARPKLATAFLGYATAAVGISPVGIDLSKVTSLWDAAVAAGKEGKEAALAAALDALQSPAPASTQPRVAGGADADVVRAVREEDGWNAFVCTAAWWVGENANSLCEEYTGRKLRSAALGKDVPAEDAPAVLHTAGGRSPLLSRILSTLQSVALTAVWQVRLAAAHAVAKIAVRSGEPYRLQCYAILAACSGSGSGDPLGLQPAVAPALAVLDQLYAAQSVLDGLWSRYGDDVEGWPDEVVTSLLRRNKQLHLMVEKYVCSVPRERYCPLGHRALLVMSAGKEEELAGLGGTLSFLTQQRSEELQQDVSVSDRTGSELAKSKNKEIESILSYSDDGGLNRFASARSDVGVVGDKNKEIESMLSGAGSGDPWGMQSNSFSSFNAFLEGEGAGSATFATQPGTGDEATPRMGGAPTSDSGFAESTWYAEEPSAAAAAGSASQPPGTPPRAAAGGARTGVVLHMFVADYNQPEELSVFEGDTVEILEESDGWMLVKDPSGNQGLVPTSYIQLDAPAVPAAAGARSPVPGGPFAQAAAQPAAASAHQRRHSRTGSLDYSTSKEDYLDNIFSGATTTTHELPTTPEDYPLAASTEDARLFGGKALSSSDAGKGQWRSDAARRNSGEWQAPANADSWSQNDSASQPLRGNDMWGGAGRSSTDNNGASSSAHVARQGSGNPFTPSHARNMSGASSSHRRSTSGGSMDFGSLPATPSRAEGQERVIVAGFEAEMDGELSVEPGERVKVHSDVGGWVRVVRLSDHKSGLVPSWAVGEA